MLRPSYAPARPRESVFISGPLAQNTEPVSSPYIEACVAAVQETCDKIYDAQRSLRRGVADLSRMSKVLENERLFVFVNESHVSLYQAQLAEEIEPQVLELAERAERGIKQLERKETVMMSKLEATQSHASSQASATHPLTAKKLDALTRQRETLEKELQSIGDEINELEGQLMNFK